MPSIDCTKRPPTRSRRPARLPVRRGHGSLHPDPLAERPHESILARHQPVRARGKCELDAPVGVRHADYPIRAHARALDRHAVAGVVVAAHRCEGASGRRARSQLERALAVARAYAVEPRDTLSAAEPATSERTADVTRARRGGAASDLV